MCCGRPDEGPQESEIVMAKPTTKGELVPLYTQLTGDAVTIGSYGQAQNTVACWVPESVAVEMAKDEDMRHRLGPAPLAPKALTIPPGHHEKAEDLEAAIQAAVDEDEGKPPRRRGRR